MDSSRDIFIVFEFAAEMIDGPTSPGIEFGINDHFSDKVTKLVITQVREFGSSPCIEDGGGGKVSIQKGTNNNSTKRRSERKKSIFRSDDVSGAAGGLLPIQRGEEGGGRRGKEGGSRVNVHQVPTILTLSIFLFFSFPFYSSSLFRSFPFLSLSFSLCFSVRTEYTPRFAFIIGTGNHGGRESSL